MVLIFSKGVDGFLEAVKHYPKAVSGFPEAMDLLSQHMNKKQSPKRVFILYTNKLTLVMIMIVAIVLIRSRECAVVSLHGCYFQ
jgi:hypothetical protein